LIRTFFAVHRQAFHQPFEFAVNDNHV